MKRKQSPTSARRSRPGEPATSPPGAWAAHPPPWQASVARGIVVAGLLASLAALLVHARVYRFLTDDAFISFRYARNLSHGFGLVFNPGHERVEGYSNFLWVLILSAFDRVGVPPERTSLALSLAMTVMLWAVVVWFAWRTHRSDGFGWVALVPAWCFAATRSLAVWSSGGLETRMFELLVIGGLLRLIVEVQATRRGMTPQPVAPWLLALASLTRPDGLLISASALGVAVVVLWRNRRVALARYLAGWIPFAILVGAQLAFRRTYYDAWLPNTFYAKATVVWWGSGIRYLSACALEYAAYLWVPLLIAGVSFHGQRGSRLIPTLFAAVVLPHMLYVAAIGGDHFEYRPLDVYFPLAFLLLGDGIRQWAGRRVLARLAPVYLGLVLVGLFELPYQSHRQFPAVYISGFPGAVDALGPRRASYLSPEADPIYWLPGLRWIAGVHRDLIGRCTARFVGIRQEEHRMFLATVADQGRQLGNLVRERVLPADYYIAMSCVGAIPYYSGVRTLDRLGLTDATVAHSADTRTLMAHGKAATLDYARQRGVDLWIGVYGLVPLTSSNLLQTIIAAGSGPSRDPGERIYAAEAGDGLLVGILPQGSASARIRAPRLVFRDLADTAFVHEFAERAIPAYRQWVQENPRDFAAVSRLGYVCMLGDRYAEARTIYEQLASLAPDQADIVENLALCQEALGDMEGARASLARLEALVLARGDSAVAARIRDHARNLGAVPRHP